jgi:hypothetical protein
MTDIRYPPTYKLLWLIAEDEPNGRCYVEEGTLERQHEQEIWEKFKK